MESFESILNHLKAVKKKQGYTNAYLAEKSGIPVSTINKIFSSIIKNPKINTVIAISNALNVDITSPNIENKLNLLHNLANSYNLSNDDIEILNRYLILSEKNRHQFYLLLGILNNFNNDSNKKNVEIIISTFFIS